MTQIQPGATVRQVSPDGLWEWNGTQWIPVQPPPGPQQVAQSTPLVQAAPPAQTTPVVQTNQISPDRKWRWDGAAWQPYIAPSQIPTAPGSVRPKKKGHLLRNLGIVAGALLLVGIGATLSRGGSSPSNTASTSPAASAPAAPAVQPPAASTNKPTAAPTAKAAGPTLTSQQQNAAKSARSYLNLTAFSRQGLIDQLSSAYGDKYPVQDATIAVDSLNVDWNAEAVQSAKSYLELTAFSCQGLIDQLDSPYGEKFTVAQATYGAQQAGAC
jgi:host cell surface-exposed lipoprotein